MHSPNDVNDFGKNGFVVIAPTRSGSSWLMDRINSIPGVEGHMELFYHSPRREPARAGYNDYPRFVETDREYGLGGRPAAVFAYLDALYARPSTVGFKLMYPQIRRYPEILFYILRRRLSVIHLVRNNHLDVILSEHLANKSGRFHAVKEDRFEQNEVISLDPGNVAASVRRLDRKQRIVRGVLRALPVPVHEVSYESLCPDNSTFINACDFIGIAGEREDREKSHLVKTQRSPHSKVISNYQEIRSALAIAGYQHLLQ